MKRLVLFLMVVCLLAFVSSPAAARDPATRGLRPAAPWIESELPELLDPNLLELNMKEAAVDTYCIVWYTFETMSWQGWSRLDRTAQRDTFFHVDDFAGLGGGDFGRLVPLEGSKSMWCGARSNIADPYVCSWAKAPGYGNNWDQSLMTNALTLVGMITVSYKLAWDVEPDQDWVSVQYDKGGGDWQELASYTGHGVTSTQQQFVTTQLRTKLRFHMTSDGAWSDEDGLWNTDGACIVDSVRVADAGSFANVENFESSAVGAHNVGLWHGKVGVAFGMYSGLRNNLQDKDPCNSNFATQIVFFIGSSEVTPAYPWPGLYSTPFCKGAGGIHAPCQSELVYSPVIDLTKYSSACNNNQNASIPSGDLPSLGGFLFRYTSYIDNPLSNLVLWDWKIRNIDESGCPGPWVGHDLIYYYWDNGVYSFVGENISNLVTASKIQVAVGLYDMCDVWYLVNGNCAQHTPAPWFDNVRVYRYKSDGPQWSYRDIDLFQDNFPEQEFDLESHVRADAANDVRPIDSPVIDPGDSIVVGCSAALGGGIAADPAGGPAVYMHVKCTYIGPAPTKPKLFGPSIAGNYGAYKSDDGTWTLIQGDTARVGSHAAVRDRYMFDLNDELFTRGYRIEYYFTALTAGGVESALPKWCRSYGPYFEFTCLPTKTSTILYVDDFNARGSFLGTAENYWRPTFAHSLAAPNWNVDIYDVNGPTSGVSNGPGSRAKNKQLTDNYEAIIWDSGDLATITISDGTMNSDKSNDCQMLIDWMELSEHKVGLWVCGDNIADDLHNLDSAPAITLMSTWCGVDLANDSYFALTGGFSGGGVVNPLLKGDTDLNLFVHTGIPDKLYIAGSCPNVNSFDVLEKTANGQYALEYPVYNLTNYHAGIGSAAMNAGGYDVRTMWFGFSLQYVRDDYISPSDGAFIDRHHIGDDVFAWMQFGLNFPCAGCTDAEVPAAYALSQNFPNPFNPSTTIKFDMKEKALVTIKVYDVAGRLVRTLVDGMKDAGAQSTIWDGRNNIGSAVASGVYFYKMETTGFSATKKLVMLR